MGSENKLEKQAKEQAREVEKPTETYYDQRQETRLMN